MKRTFQAWECVVLGLAARTGVRMPVEQAIKKQAEACWWDGEQMRITSLVLQRGERAQGDGGRCDHGA